MIDVIDSKIKRIEILLEDDMELDKYISNIDKVNIENNKSLKSRIISNVRKTNEISKKSYKILKLAACATFAIILCQTNFVKAGTFEKKEKNNKDMVLIQSINKGVNKLNDLCMNGISFDNKEEKE